jgi:hypothetical protein
LTSKSILGFGGDGPHEVHIRTDQGERTLWVKRDLWFDRDDDKNWIAWVQHRSWDDDDPPTDDEGEAATLGSIVVTHPAVMAFIDQLGELLIDPQEFRDEPEFAEPRALRPAEELSRIRAELMLARRIARNGPDSLRGSDRHPARHGRPGDRDVGAAVPRTLMVLPDP